MPPAPVRRPVSVALGLIAALAGLVASPALLAVAALARAAGRPKPLIAVRLMSAYCVRELGVLAGCGALWLLAGAGILIGRPRLQRAHWRLLRWFVHGLTARALALLQVGVRVDCPAPAAHVLADPAPVIVLSRHAGPGDTLLLIDRLICSYGRRPSVVLRQEIALDPAIDLLTSRLPHGVIDTDDGGASEETIERLAAGLGRRGALLLYPEGGNFTVQRRRSALASLRRKGRHKAAAAAQEMENLLPPRPSGVQSALRGRPDAPVLFVAHTGLGLAAYPRQIYRDLPAGRTLRMRMWLVEPTDIPATEDEQVSWLNHWWQTLDDWIDAQQTEPPRAAAA